MRLPPHPGVVAANVACASAMFMWATAFPASEILLESWGTIALSFFKIAAGVPVLCVFWLLADGWTQVRDAPWLKGLMVGGTGFGIGMILLLVGQAYSDPVTPAIAAAMMPIAGAALEVLLDGRKLTLKLTIGIVFALSGGYLATGVKLSDGSFGLGALLCLSAVILFAWGTRATTRYFQMLSPMGQTTITMVGASALTTVVTLVWVVAGLPGGEFGKMDAKNIGLLVVLVLPSFAIAQTLWIWGAGGLGILLASFHMNAVPFYVMVILVVLMGEQWNWGQAMGAALVGAGVMIAQYNRRRKRDPYVHPD